MDNTARELTNALFDSGVDIAFAKRKERKESGIIYPGKREEKRVIIPTEDEVKTYGYREKKRAYGSNRAAAHTEGYLLGFTRKNKEYKKWLDEHPWVRWDKINQIWKIPLHKVIYDGIRKINIPVGNRTNLFKDIVGSVLDAYEVRFKNSYEMLPFEIFPRIRTELTFAEGATNIDRLYTVEDSGYEFPVYLRSCPEDGNIRDPTDQDLQQNIDKVRTEKVSAYDKMNADGLLNNDFLKFSIDKFTRTDYKYFEQESQRINRWLVKDDTWFIQQYGERDTDMENALTPQFQGVVKIYKRPTGEEGFWYKLGRLLFDKTPRSGKMWWYWKVGDWTYDVMDTIFDPVQEMLERTNVPEEGIRAVFRSEYKNIAKARRGLFNPRTPYLKYSLN